MSSVSGDLKDITVIILSRKRQHCLQRVIPFWEKYGIRTLIIDQSPSPLKRNVLDELKIGQYVHLNSPFRERCKKVIDMLHSDYSIVISDDELYVPSALHKMLLTLKQNPELISVGAMALSIWRYGFRQCGSWPYKATFGYKNLEENSLSRIEKHTQNGKQSITSFLTSNLTRSEQIKDCLRLYSKSQIIATEAASTFAVCSAGRFLYVDVLYWIRNWNEPPKSNIDWDRKVMIHDWWPNRKSLSPEKYTDFENELRQIYSKYSTTEGFDRAWELILSASKNSSSELSSGIEQKKWHQNKLLNHFKLLVKTLFDHDNLPQTAKETMLQMQLNGVDIDEIQINEAISIVSKLYPYKNW